MRRQFLKAGAAAALALLASAAAHAGDFPSKPVRLVVGYAPGGATDIVARLLQPEVSKRLGQQLVIDNRPGANGNIANEIVAHAEPDGHTILLGNPGPLVLNPLLFKSVPVDPATAFAPVSQLTESPLVVVVPAASPVKTLRGLIDRAKARDGLNFGSAGNGSSMHVAGATLQLATGAKLVHVPYKGSGPAMNDLLAGVLDFMPDSRSTTKPFIKDGRLRALAVTGSKRVADLPEVPTVEEALGLRGFNVTTWLGIVAPAGTPKDVIARLHQAFAESLAVPAVAQRFEALGTATLGSTPEEFARALDAERRAARTLVQRTGMSIE